MFFIKFSKENMIVSGIDIKGRRFGLEEGRFGIVIFSFFVVRYLRISFRESRGVECR